MPAVGTSRLTPINTINQELICGVELEIENLPQGAGWYIDRSRPFFRVEEDGSLRPRGESWEFISSPAPMGVVLAEMQELFPKIGVREDQNYTDRCSVHVHTNVQDFTKEQLSNLTLIYPVFEEVLFQYVNHHKKKEEQGYCRDTNLYCIPWSACRLNRNMVEKILENPIHMRNWQKYTALNFLPITEHGTVEWRHMHGTCDMEKLTTWFNIIGAIMLYVKNTSFDEIVKAIKVMNDVSTYQQFFHTVLQGSLPYDDEYRRLMADGVVNAKYSLINWEANKKNPKETKRSKITIGDWEAAPATIYDEFPDFVAEAQAREARLREHLNVFADRLAGTQMLRNQGLIGAAADIPPQANPNYRPQIRPQIRRR